MNVAYSCVFIIVNNLYILFLIGYCWIYDLFHLFKPKKQDFLLSLRKLSHCANSLNYHLMCMVYFKSLIFLVGLDTFSGCVQCGSTRLWWYRSGLSLPRRDKMCNQDCMHFQHPGKRISPLYPVWKTHAVSIVKA